MAAEETVIQFPTWLTRRVRQEAAPEPEAVKANPVETMVSTQAGISTRPWDAELYARQPETHATIMACVGLVAESTPMVKPKLYQGEDEVEDHPVLDLLKRPNPHMGYYGLFEATIGFRELHGNAYWLLIRGADMQKMSRELWAAAKAGLTPPEWDSFAEKAATRSQAIAEIYPLRPDRVTIIPDSTQKAAGYEYRISANPNTKPITFAPEEIIHFSYWNPNNDLYGLSRLGALRIGLTLDYSRIAYQQAMFDNDGRPAGLLTSENDLNEAQLKTYQERWQEQYGGPKKQGKTAVLGSGLSYQAIGVPPKDMEFALLEKKTALEICAVFRVPPILIGKYEYATLANFREALAMFWQYGIGPRCEKTDEALDCQFLPHFGEGLDIEFDWQPMIPRDEKERADMAIALVDRGIWTQNMAREYLGDREPVAWGDVWWAPFNLYPISGAEERPAPIPMEPPPTEEAVPAEEVPEKARQAKDLQRLAKWRVADGRRLVGERMMRDMLKREFTEQEGRILERLRAAAGGKRLQKLGVEAIVALFPYTTEVETLRNAMLPVLAHMVEQSGQAALAELGLDIVFNLENPRARRFMETQKQRFATGVNDTTWKELRSSLAEGIESGENLASLEGRVGRTFDMARGYRTERIARTESLAANNGGAQEAYREARDQGVQVRKEWVSTQDDDTRGNDPKDEYDHLAMDGEKVGVDEAFDVQGDMLEFPGDPGGQPANTINCRCAVSPVVE